MNPQELFLGTDPLALVLVGVALSNLVLAGIVFRAARGPREETRVFSVLAVSVALWCLTNALFQIAPSVAVATLWAELAYASALSTAAAFLHFAWIYPRSMPVSVRQKNFLWLLTLGVALVSFVPGLVIRGVDLDSRRILTAPGLWLIAAFLLGTSVPAFSLFFGHQKRLRGRPRARARYVLFGSFLTALLGLTFNLLLPLVGDYRFVWAGPLSSLFFVGFCAYSIAAHHLFDVRLLIRRTLVYTLLLALLAGAFGALEKGLEQLLHPYIGSDGSFSTDLLAALLVGFAIDPLKRWLGERASHWLFRGEEGRVEEGQLAEGSPLEGHKSTAETREEPEDL